MLNENNIDAMEDHLIACDAFKDPKEGMLKVGV
jgi:hypothetical protein